MNHQLSKKQQDDLGLWLLCQWYQDNIDEIADVKIANMTKTILDQKKSFSKLSQIEIECSFSIEQQAYDQFTAQHHTEKNPEGVSDTLPSKVDRNVNIEPHDHNTNSKEVLEFSEDSPMFRTRLYNFENNLFALPQLLKSISTASSKYSSVCGKLCRKCNKFGKTLLNEDTKSVHPVEKSPLTIKRWNNTLGILLPIFEKCGELFVEFSSYIKDLSTSSSDYFGDSIVNYFTVELAEIETTRKNFHHISEEYSSLLARFLQNSKSVSKEAIHNSRKSFELSRLNYVNKLNIAKSKKNAKIASEVVALLQAHLTFLSQCTPIKKKLISLLQNLESLSKVNNEECLVHCSSHDDERLKISTQIDNLDNLSIMQGGEMSSYIIGKKEVCGGHSGIIHQGYLFKKAESMINTAKKKVWQRYWFILDSKKLEYLSRNYLHKENNLTLECEVKLCTLRPFREVNFGFEIRTHDDQSYFFQAESAQHLTNWQKALQICIESSLNSQESLYAENLSTKKSNIFKNKNLQTLNTIMSNMKKSSPKSFSNFHSFKSSLLSPPSSPSTPTSDCFAGINKKEYFDKIKEIRYLNPLCADCGEKNPDWCSLNLCVVICIECSGIHRSLGVHISKIRSLSLDRLNSTQIKLLKELGNNFVNNIYLRLDICDTGQINSLGVASKLSPPNCTSSRLKKEEWIKAKYLSRNTIRSSDDSNLLLYNAIVEKNIKNIYLYISNKADLYFKNPDDNNRCVLHRACADGFLLGVEMLVLNGMKFEVRDNSECTPIDLAMLYNRVELLEHAQVYYKLKQ